MMDKKLIGTCDTCDKWLYAQNATDSSPGVCLFGVCVYKGYFTQDPSTFGCMFHGDKLVAAPETDQR